MKTEKSKPLELSCNEQLGPIQNGPIQNGPVSADIQTLIRNIINAKPLGPEFEKVLRDNFWDLLLEENPSCKVCAHDLSKPSGYVCPSKDCPNFHKAK